MSCPSTCWVTPSYQNVEFSLWSTHMHIHCLYSLYNFKLFREESSVILLRVGWNGCLQDCGCLLCKGWAGRDVWQRGMGGRLGSYRLSVNLPIFSPLTYLDFQASLGFLSPDLLRDSSSQVVHFSHSSFLWVGCCDSPALLHLLPLLCHPIFQKSVEISQALMLFLHFYFCYCQFIYFLYFSYHFNEVLGGRERGKKICDQPILKWRDLKRIPLL